MGVIEEAKRPLPLAAQRAEREERGKTRETDKQTAAYAMSVPDMAYQACRGIAGHGGSGW